MLFVHCKRPYNFFDFTIYDLQLLDTNNLRYGLNPNRSLDQHFATMSSFLFIYAIAAFLSSSCPSVHFAVARYACNEHLNNLTDINNVSSSASLWRRRSDEIIIGMILTRHALISIKARLVGNKGTLLFH